MKVLLKAVFAACLTLSALTAACAQSAAAAASAPQSMSTGEVRKVDKSAGRVTIKHGPLDNIGMGAMTMAFRVKDAAMLEQVSVGDKIHFVAEQPNGQLTVTQLKKQQ